jgi:RecA/RadA recombinase
MVGHEFRKIATNCASFDRLIHGGFPPGELSLIYGEAGTGKSTALLQCTINCARLGFKTFFIDADRAFSVERLKQMAQYDLNEITPLIGIFPLNNFYEQSILIEKLDRFITRNVRLVLVDTINSLYRLAIPNLEQAASLNKELNRQLAYLTQWAKVYSIPVILTSQVRSVLEEAFLVERTEPVATRTLHYWCKNVINFRPSSKSDVKMAFLEKFGGKKLSNTFCYFRLSDKGMEEC